MTRKPVVLSGEQVQVLALLARGADFPQIAREVAITVNAARVHYKAAADLLGGLTPAHAVALAIAAGHLPADVAYQSNS